MEINTIFRESEEEILKVTPACNFKEKSNLSKRRRVLWTKKDNMKLYRCYCLTQLKKLPIKNETFVLWRKRNPTVRPTIERKR